MIGLSIGEILLGVVVLCFVGAFVTMGFLANAVEDLVNDDSWKLPNDKPTEFTRRTKLNDEVKRAKEDIAHHVTGAIYHPLDHSSGPHAFADAIEKLVDIKVREALTQSSRENNG